jgi:glycosyltransferase involved in cell wall biosynthesis
MEEATYSVVIPAYNATNTIVASVASCLNQTLPPHEIIVVNDASTDNTLALLHQNFGDAIQVISLSENSGPSAARNAGLALASGKYIAFQDADDIWHREKLACIDRVLQKHPNIRFLFHPYTLSSVTFDVDETLLQPKGFSIWKVLLSNPIGTPCVIMRRDSGIRFNEQLHYMEDYELFLREAAKHGVYRIDAPFTRLGRPILSSGGQSSNRWRMRVGEMRAWWSFVKHNPAYLIALPFLILFSLAKHLVKSFFPPRANY